MPPPELVRAEVIDGIAQRYGRLPSEVAREDAHELLHMLTVLKLGEPEQKSGG